MIKPVSQNQALAAEIKAYSGHNAFKVWWLGQSGFLIKWEGKTILFDPYLSDSLSEKYKDTDKPHTRVSELVIEPQLLPEIDIVTSSHNHTDHLDALTLKPILAAKPSIKFIIPEANRAFVAERTGCDLEFPIGLNDGLSTETAGIKITGIPAAHNNIDRDAAGNLKCMGFIAQFGGFTVYHSGDTLWYPELTEILLEHKVDLCFLPINGNKPERRVAGNLSFLEAAELAKAVKAKCVIPHHYDLFEFNTEDPRLFEAACLDLDINYKVMLLGEGFEFSH
jgi:L-ascorbate metabolism protein UlaG (beta-lactamase superfamily)